MIQDRFSRQYISTAIVPLWLETIENCYSTLHRIQWIRTSNAVSLKQRAFVAQVHISVVRDITRCYCVTFLKPFQYQPMKLNNTNWMLNCLKNKTTVLINL